MTQKLKRLLFYLAIVISSISCSENEENIENQQSFEPIEIQFELDFFTECNQVRTVEGVNLSILPWSEDELDPNGLNADMIGTCTDYGLGFRNLEGFDDERDGLVGMFLAPSLLEIDFSDLEGISNISIVVADNAGGTVARLYESNTIVDTKFAQQSGFTVENLVFTQITEDATKIRLGSFEGEVYYIRFE